MIDYVKAGVKTLGTTVITLAAIAAFVAVALAIMLGLMTAIIWIGGVGAMDVASGLFIAAFLFWLIGIPVIELFNRNLRKIRNEKVKNAQVSVD